MILAPMGSFVLLYFFSQQNIKRKFNQIMANIIGIPINFNWTCIREVDWFSQNSQLELWIYLLQNNKFSWICYKNLKGFSLFIKTFALSMCSRKWVLAHPQYSKDTSPHLGFKYVYIRILYILLHTIHRDCICLTVI